MALKKHRSREEWHALINRFEHSGLSQAAFCQQQAIACSTFHRWYRLLSNGSITATDSSVTRPPTTGFIAVDVSQSQAAPEQKDVTGHLQCTLPNGIQLSWPTTVPPTYIATLLHESGLHA